MTARSTQRPTLITCIRDGRCVGTILSRGPQGFESFDSCDRSIGTFESAELARDAVLRSRAA
jgi:hypothetical protein